MRGRSRQWRRPGRRIRARIALLSLGIALSLIAFGLLDAPNHIDLQGRASAAQKNPAEVQELPSDAEMIAWFQTHRKEFQELVRLYQTDERRNKVGNREPFWTVQYTQLLQRAGIDHLSGDGALWLPDPYARETAKRARSIRRIGAYASHGMFFAPDNRVLSRQVGGWVWKDYFFVPVVPKVDQGRLWWPLVERENLSLHQWSRGVFESLDRYPSEWLQPLAREEGCVFRRLEAQWFLRLCVS